MPRTDASRLTQAKRFVTGRALAAVAGQLSQAIGSFVLQALAAHLLGASGLGAFALLYSVMLMATAVSSGLVGDSLTVLDRSQASIRSGLQYWCGISSLATGIAGSVVFYITHVVTAPEAVAYAAAVCAFTVESILRRLLMATMRFWNLVLVDTSGLLASLAILAVCSLRGPLTLFELLVGWAVGQMVGSGIAVVCMPKTDRWLATWRPQALMEVLKFGGWRAAQQGIRPSMMTGARIIVTVAAGRAMFGQLEAARVYMAPALLVVQGLGSYLFSSYALRNGKTIRDLTRRADRASQVMLAATLALGIVATIAYPWVGGLVTGSSFSMTPIAIFGWAVYAASTGAVMPFASLAAVRGRQRTVMLLRSVDSAASLLLLAIFVFMLRLDISWAPYALAIGSFGDGVVIRWLILRPLARGDVSKEIWQRTPVATGTGSAELVNEDRAH